MICIVPLPEALGLMARTGLEAWLLGDISDRNFLFYATVMNSDNFQWAECLIRLIG